MILDLSMTIGEARAAVTAARITGDAAVAEAIAAKRKLAWLSAPRNMVGDVAWLTDGWVAFAALPGVELPVPGTPPTVGDVADLLSSLVPAETSEYHDGHDPRYAPWLAWWARQDGVTHHVMGHHPMSGVVMVIRRHGEPVGMVVMVSRREPKRCDHRGVPL